MFRIRMVLRRVLRAALLRMAARLEDAAPAGGPPKHWLEKVRKASPQFVESGGAQPPAEQPKRAPSPVEVAQRRAVSAGKARGGNGTYGTDRTYGSAEAAGSHRSHESHLSHRSHRASDDAEESPAPPRKHHWPELNDPPSPARKRHHPELDADLELQNWPDLPDLPPAAIEAILSLDDLDRLRLLDEEQRGSAWNE
jgi:hypothetical protein